MFSHKRWIPVVLGWLAPALVYAGTGAAPVSGQASTTTVQPVESTAPLASNPRAVLGAIVGVVTNSAKLPVARATVTAVRMDGTGIRATVAGSDGVYSFADLAPGVWSVSSQADGYPETPVSSLAVVASKATRLDIVMSGGSTTPGPAAPSAPPLVAQAPRVPEALQEPAPGPEVDTDTPFAVGYLGWMNGTSREKAPVFDTKFFTPEIRFDANYLQDFNHPINHTIVGSTEEFRSGEFQIAQVSFGGDFHWHNVRARFLSMCKSISPAD